MFDLYLITPERSPGAIATRVRALLAAAPPGRVGVQLRAAQLTASERTALAHELRRLTREHGAALLVNAELALAREVEADGVQLPERGPSIAEARAVLGPAALIGASRHDLLGVQSAERAGASFATLSPVFSVPDKGEPLGVERFAAIARSTSLPLFALGGITAARAVHVLDAGAYGLAVIRELLDSEQPAHQLAALLAALDAHRQAHPT